ncbi:hypothetical protein HWV62_19487 [Athelia sp. TMB]|nr:hypothetical protein HWV62_19487 [Athelia sp. TMB]
MTGITHYISEGNEFPSAPMDSATEVLVVSLIIVDAEVILAAKTGKARGDLLISDDELAAQEQLNDGKARLAFLQDCALACSLDRALRLDGDLLQTLCNIDQAEHEDHAAAVALSEGQPLPAPTPLQRSLELPTPSVSDQVEPQSEEVLATNLNPVTSEPLNTPSSKFVPQRASMHHAGITIATDVL